MFSRSHVKLIWLGDASEEAICNGYWRCLPKYTPTVYDHCQIFML